MIFSIISWNMCIESKAMSEVRDWKIPEMVWQTPSSHSGTGNGTIGRQYHYSKDWLLTTGVNFDSNYYYLFNFYKQDLSAVSTSTYSGYGAVDYDCYFRYAGKEYLFNNSFSVILPGNLGSTLGLGIRADVTSIAHVVGNVEHDNVFYCTFKWSPSLQIMKLTADEVKAYQGSSLVIDGIDKGNDLAEEGNKLQEENNKLQEEQNETSKGILGAIKDFFGSFFGNLIDSVVSLFVPSADEMSDLLDRLNEFFSNTFGFLYYPFEILIDFLNVFIDSSAETELTFPSFSIMGHEVWSEQRYDLSSDTLAGKVFSYVRIGTGALLAVAFILYFREFFDKRFGGGGS